MRFEKALVAVGITVFALASTAQQSAPNSGPFDVLITCMQLNENLDDTARARLCEAALARGEIDETFQADVHDALSLYYGQRKDTTNKLKHLNASIKLRPAALSFMSRGAVYLTIREYQRALADYENAWARASNNKLRSDILVGRALAYDGLGNWRQAISDAEQAYQFVQSPKTTKVLEELKKAGPRGL